MWSIGVIAYSILTGQMPFVVKDASLSEKRSTKLLMELIKKKEDHYKIFEQEAFTNGTLEQEEIDFIKCLLRHDYEGDIDKEFRRWTAEEALEESSWMKKANEIQIANLTSGSTQTDKDMKEYAQKALDSFRNFSPTDKGEPMLKEATLALIAAKLLEQSQKNIAVNIFNIMDQSGDGDLQKEEIQRGYKSILAEVLEDSEAQKIVDQVDIYSKEKLSFHEFIIASIDTSKDSIISYLHKVYIQFFQKNDMEEIEREELSDSLHRERELQQFAGTFIKSFDESMQMIPFEDFVKVFVKNLGLNISWEEIKAELKIKIPELGEIDF